MTTWRKGDIALVSVSFTDQSGIKLRPAVIVSSEVYNRQSPDVLIASITGNLGAVRHPGDHLIRDWQSAGLLRPSLVQAKIATVAWPLLTRRLGSLSRHDLSKVERGLRVAFGIP